jgi:uncharacterized membrane protein
MKPRQISNPFKKGNRYEFKKQKQFLLSILTLFAVVFAIMFMQNLSDMFMLAGFGSTMFASMAIIGNVDDVSDRYTSGNDIAYQVYLVNRKQVDPSIAFPKPNANREVATIPLLSGELMHYFEAHTKPTYVGTGEKGDVTTTGTNTVVVLMGGNREVLLNFAEEFAGDKFILIYKEISTGKWFILGNYDDPCVLSNYENKHNADGRYVTFTFTRSSIFQPCIYAGSITTVAPGNHTAGATALAISAGVDLYNIPNGTSDTYAIATLSGLTSSSKGRYITLIGQGTTHSATIADGASFVLEDGATWMASQGSRITFRVMDSSTLVEISRVQA